MRPLEPEAFPWYDYRGFTFSLGLEVDGHVFSSGHSGSVFDPAQGKPDVAGGMAEQAAVGYAKQAAVLAAAGLSMADVTRVVENVTVAGLAHYAEAEQLRRKVFGAHQPVVVTVVVDRLVRRKALIEVEVHASPGAGRELAAGDGDGAGWRRGTIREGHDGAVYLPTLLPIDRTGAVVAEGDYAGQLEYCFDRAAQLLAAVGLPLSQLVSAVEYAVPGAERSGGDRLRAERLGPVAPASAAIMMSRLHEPQVMVAIDAVASRLPLRPIGQRGVRAGRTLYLSQSSGHQPGDLRGQAETAYAALLGTLGPAHLLSTVEYVTPAALPSYRDVAQVRRDLLPQPYPVSTGIVCAALPHPDSMLSVVATAVIAGEPDVTAH